MMWCRGAGHCGCLLLISEINCRIWTCCFCAYASVRIKGLRKDTRKVHVNHISRCCVSGCGCPSWAGHARGSSGRCVLYKFFEDIQSGIPIALLLCYNQAPTNTRDGLRLRESKKRVPYNTDRTGKTLNT